MSTSILSLIPDSLKDQLFEEVQEELKKRNKEAEQGGSGNKGQGSTPPNMEDEIKEWAKQNTKNK